MKSNASHIHINCLHYAGKVVTNEGEFNYMRAVAKERADELVTLGYQCYASDDYTIKKGYDPNKFKN